jgi:hypothetical protein
MAHKPEAPFGERTEAEIRKWVRDRDAGPAPERLRMRIARIAESKPAPRWGFRAVLRPAYALGGAVAAVALIVVAMVLRATPGPAAPGASATPSGPSPEPTTVLMPAMPNGPWPRTGPVLAVALDGPLLVGVAVLALLAALLIVTWIALVTRREARRSEPPLTWSWLGLWASRPRRSRAARAFAVLWAGVMIAVGCGLLQFAQSTPLGYGSSFGGASSSLGGRSGTGAGAGEAYYPFVSGGELDLLISLSNQGDLPLTVTSFDEARFLSEQPAGKYISSVELRLPPGASSICDEYPPSGTHPTSLCTQPFHPFELPSWHESGYGETLLSMIVHMKSCPLVAPGPTANPSASSQQNYLPMTPYVTFGELPFRYSVLGVEREVDVRMFEAVGIVFGSSEVAC